MHIVEEDFHQSVRFTVTCESAIYSFFSKVDLFHFRNYSRTFPREASRKYLIVSAVSHVVAHNFTQAWLSREPFSCSIFLISLAKP